MNKIVVLDGYTENPGDLSWEGLEKLGETTVYDRTPLHLIVERAQGANIILTNKTPITKETLAQLPDLKYIGVLATGYNVVDVEAAKQMNIPVCNIPTYGTDSVAQMCFALILEFYNRVGLHDEAVKKGEWSSSPDFCFWKSPLIELKGKTIGFIGFGRIGQRAADIAEAFGMNGIAYDLYPSDQNHRKNFKYVEQDELFQTADIISLHCNLTAENTGFINKEAITKMKNNVLIVNTSRGPLINESDVIQALKDSEIGGLAADVLTVEPPSENHPLFTAPNTLITPHISWATYEARKRLMDIAVNNVENYLAGKAVNVVAV